MGAGASTPSASADAKSSPPAGVCPVDDKARAAWLSQNQGSVPHPVPPSNDTNPPSKASSNPNPNRPSKLQRPLSQDREVSSIPRAAPTTSGPQLSVPKPSLSPYAQQQQSSSAVPSHGTPSNSESETGHDTKSGNWIYPSERQFFEALVRKGTPTSTNSASELATSVASIIPIHNAVNERAWSEIQSWESAAPTTDPGSKKCGGPKLYSFRGLGVETQFLSPRARFNGLVGYQLPFDRHDWVVERCGGERVEYVIDFYQGKGRNGGGLGSGSSGGKVSFYLDVRPKLNSWEGCRMRMNRFLGL